MGRPLEEVFHILSEATREPVESPVARVLNEGVVVGLGNHTILIDRSGKERPIDDSAAPIRGESEEISGVVLVFRDVTERRQAEQAADEANRRMIEILDSIADASFALDLEARFTYVNPRWETYFGMSRIRSSATWLGVVSERPGHADRGALSPGVARSRRCH